MKTTSYEVAYPAEYWQGELKYKNHEGQEKLYAPPGRYWHGFSWVIDNILNLISRPQTAFDVGCSFGLVVHMLVERGVDAYGMDVSQYAIDRCLGLAYGRVKHGNVVTEPFGMDYDLVTAFDLLEHIYITDLDVLLAKIYKHCHRYFVGVISTTHPDNQYSLKQDETVPELLESIAVSRHWNMQPAQWWYDKIESNGFSLMRDHMTEFEKRRLVSPLQNMIAWDKDHFFMTKKNV